MNLSAASAGGGSGAEGARGRLQVRQKVQRLQHKQSVDKVNMEMDNQTLLKGRYEHFEVSAVWMGLKIDYYLYQHILYPIEHN